MGEEVLQPQHAFLPVISDETRQHLLEELGLDKDEKSRQIVSGITGERGVNPYMAIEDWTVSVFSRLADYNQAFVEVLNSVLEKKYVTIYGGGDRYLCGCSFKRNGSCFAKLSD